MYYSYLSSYLKRSKFKANDNRLKFPKTPEISVELKDFFLKILEKNPSDRLDVNGILNHPWIKGEKMKEEDLKQDDNKDNTAEKIEEVKGK